MLSVDIIDSGFEDIVLAHHRAVSAYAHALCIDRTIAEDAVQETFLRAWKYLDTYRSQGSFEGWLLTICRRSVIDLAQRENRYSEPIPIGRLSVPPDESADLI